MLQHAWGCVQATSLIFRYDQTRYLLCALAHTPAFEDETRGRKEEGRLASSAQHHQRRWTDLIAWTCERGQRAVRRGGVSIEAEAVFDSE